MKPLPGAGELDAAYVLEIDPQGKTVRRVQLPESPGIGMNRYLAVTPDGRTLKADATAQTFRILVRILEYRSPLTFPIPAPSTVFRGRLLGSGKGLPEGAGYGTI